MAQNDNFPDLIEKMAQRKNKIDVNFLQGRSNGCVNFKTSTSSDVNNLAKMMHMLHT